jgi:hypothetical protein
MPEGGLIRIIYNGFSLSRISFRLFIKPKTAEVFIPLELMRGLRTKAKWARYISANASRRKSFEGVSDMFLDDE